MSGKLTIVPTPIGNLGDMTPRALEALEQANFVCAEDTRVTGKLLSHFDIHAKLERCDENVISAKAPALVARMLDGERIAFCSDAGMPGISDPGCALVDAARDAGVDVEVLPGASAVTTALVTSGFKFNAFYFGGFLPRKDSERAMLLDSLKELDAALVFYESPHRVIASIKSIAKAFGERPVALCRELTKMHEEVLRLPAIQLVQNLEARDSIKGEIVLVIAPPAAKTENEPSLEDPILRARIEQELASGTSKSFLAKKLAQETGFSKNKLYELILTFEV